MSLATFYSKIFGLGLFLGGSLEVVLVKSNYCMSLHSLCVPTLGIHACFNIDQMLAASEAKQRVKALEQEKEDMERLKRISQPNQPVEEHTNKE